MAGVETQKNGAALVVGAGIAGMQAALDLAAMDIPVYLLERSAAIGGNMARLDKTFPTNDCSSCMLSPRTVAIAREPRITILTLSELLGLDGEPGRFTARVKQFPRYVDEKLCVACRQCVQKCPKKLPNAYNARLDQRKAIDFEHSQAIPMVPYVDTAHCIYFLKGRCRACEKVCPTGAVDLDRAPTELELQVGAVVVSAGYELALVSQAGEYGYGRYPNVLTNLDYERMLSAAGPFGGEVLRPSDAVKAKKVAWIQCVASRDSARNRNFCSAVCCMAAVKQALITREHDREVETTIFYMDIRAQGKDFDRYVLRARDTHGVRFVHSMLSQVVRNPLNDNLILEYYDSGFTRQEREEFDIVVLSAGMKPQEDAVSLAKRLDLELNEYGFVSHDIERVGATSREGVFVCGAIDGPKDIPESVAAASAAAGSAAVFLADAFGSQNGAEGLGSSVLETRPGAGGAKQEGGDNEPVTRPAAPGSVIPFPGPGPSVSAPQGQPDLGEPRIAVFVCHCGKNIAGVVDVEALKESARRMPHVTVAEDFMFTCSTQTQERIKELIGEHRVNRVVVAACSPRTHEPLFRETLQRAGLNKYLFEMANIRDQCSWVHGNEPGAATEKAESLIRASVSRAALLAPIEDVETEVVRRALVIGGGLAGMSAALSLADQGIEVVLVEKDRALGGMAKKIHSTPEGPSPRHMAEDLALRVKTHRRVVLFTEASLSSISGGVGSFEGLIESEGQSLPVKFGALIVATGGQPYVPTEYFYGRHESVLTQLELEERLRTDTMPLPQQTVMIQCVGSRNDEFPLCSRVCCTAAVKNSIRLMEKNPEGSVYVLYRDMRTFGFKEKYYKRARDLGVVFVRYEPESAPEVELDDGGLRVSVTDQPIGLGLYIRPDLLVLSSGVRPGPYAGEIARMLKVPLTQEGFFMEAHPKLNPLEFSAPGVFLCGLAHSPRFVEETIAQAKGAACKAAGLLLQEQIRTSGAVAEVIRERCSSCLVCVRSCPYNVPVMDAEGISFIDPRSCKGCGICSAECPAKAISFKHYTDEQVDAQLCG